MPTKNTAIPIMVTAASLEVLTDMIDRLQKDLDRTRRNESNKYDEAYIYRRCLEQLLRTPETDVSVDARIAISKALDDRGKSLGGGG